MSVDTSRTRGNLRIGVFATHPIQYQVPIWRGLSAEPGFDVEVFYFSEQGLADTYDPGFGAQVKWDVPLLEGYKSTFLDRAPIDAVDRCGIPEAKKLLAASCFDVVLLHGYMHRFARQLVRRKKHHGYRIVLRAEFTDVPRDGRGWLRTVTRGAYLEWFYRHVDHFCTIGRNSTCHLVHFGVPPERMTFTPYSVDDSLIEASMRQFTRAASREALGLREGDVVVLFSGKMIPRKQPLLLAQALADLAGRYDHLAAVFLGSGEQHAEVVAKLEPLLGEKLIAPGFVNQSQLGRYFTAADVFVLPSAYDTWGLVVNEAMHYGLPCIVSDKVGAGSDLVVSGVTGDIFSHDSFDELVRCLEMHLLDSEYTHRLKNNVPGMIEKYALGRTVEGLVDALCAAARS